MDELVLCLEVFARIGSPGTLLEKVRKIRSEDADTTFQCVKIFVADATEDKTTYDAHRHVFDDHPLVPRLDALLVSSFNLQSFYSHGLHVLFRDPVAIRQGAAARRAYVHAPAMQFYPSPVNIRDWENPWAKGRLRGFDREYRNLDPKA